MVERALIDPFKDAKLAAVKTMLLCRLEFIAANFALNDAESVEERVVNEVDKEEINAICEASAVRARAISTARDAVRLLIREDCDASNVD